MSEESNGITGTAEYSSVYILAIIPSSKAIVQKRDHEPIPPNLEMFYAWGSITYQEVK